MASKYPEIYKYTQDDEWVLVDGDTAIIGITDYAQNELSDIVFVELPTVGQMVEAGDQIGTVESVKAVAELYSPVTGEVVAVNVRLEDEPEMLNNEPHGEAWIVKVKMSGDLPAGLMSADDYEAYLADR